LGRGGVSFLVLVLGIDMRRTGSVVWRGGAGRVLGVLVLVFAGGAAVSGVLDDSVEGGGRAESSSAGDGDGSGLIDEDGDTRDGSR